MKTMFALLALSLVACGYCGASPGETEASIYVTDAATGKSVLSPSFAVDGRPVDVGCGDATCTSWLLIEDPGAYTVTVSAAGYRAATVHVDTTATDSIHVAVELIAL